MAFENINVGSLKSALVQCKNSIDYHVTNELRSNVSNTSVWNCSAQSNLKNALTKLINDRYSPLQSKINDYINAVSLIEKYQNLQQENRNLESQYMNLSGHLYITKTETISKIDSHGLLKANVQSTRQKDTNVEIRMNNIRSQINENYEKMENLINKVSNLI